MAGTGQLVKEVGTGPRGNLGIKESIGDLRESLKQLLANGPHHISVYDPFPQKAEHLKEALTGLVCTPPNNTIKVDVVTDPNVQPDNPGRVIYVPNPGDFNFLFCPKKRSIAKVPAGLNLVGDVSFDYGCGLASPSTMKIGGTVDCIATPETYEGFLELIGFCFEKRLPLHALGNGSNTVFGDVPGVVTKTGGLNRIIAVETGGKKYDFSPFDKVTSLLDSRIKTIVDKTPEGQDIYLEVEAGIPAPSLSRQAAKLGISGLEYLCGIPGRFGGIAVMNAGTGTYMTDQILVGVKTIEKLGKLRILTLEDLKPDYKFTTLQTQYSRNMVYSVTLRVKKSDPGTVRNDTLRFLENRKDEPGRRKGYEPGGPSCGSAWRRGGYKINGSGHEANTDDILRELGIGGWKSDAGNLVVPEFPDRRLGWIVNPEGRATAYELLELASRIYTLCLEKRNVSLSLEIKLIGNTPSGIPLIQAYKMMIPDENGKVEASHPDAMKRFGYSN